MLSSGITDNQSYWRKFILTFVQRTSVLRKRDHCWKNCKDLHIWTGSAYLTEFPLEASWAANLLTWLSEGWLWPPTDFETWHFSVKFLAKKGHFFSFEWVNWNFATLPPLKFFRNPCLLIWPKAAVCCDFAVLWFLHLQHNHILVLKA